MTAASTEANAAVMTIAYVAGTGNDEAGTGELWSADDSCGAELIVAHGALLCKRKGNTSPLGEDAFPEG